MSCLQFYPLQVLSLLHHSGTPSTQPQIPHFSLISIYIAVNLMHFSSQGNITAKLTTCSGPMTVITEIAASEMQPRGRNWLSFCVFSLRGGLISLWCQMLLSSSLGIQSVCGMACTSQCVIWFLANSVVHSPLRWSHILRTSCGVGLQCMTTEPQQSGLEGGRAIFQLNHSIQLKHPLAGHLPLTSTHLGTEHCPGEHWWTSCQVHHLESTWIPSPVGLNWKTVPRELCLAHMQMQCTVWEVCGVYLLGFTHSMSVLTWPVLMALSMRSCPSSKFTHVSCDEESGAMLGTCPHFIDSLTRISDHSHGLSPPYCLATVLVITPVTWCSLLTCGVSLNVMFFLIPLMLGIHAFSNRLRISFLLITSGFSFPGQLASVLPFILAIFVSISFWNWAGAVGLWWQCCKHRWLITATHPAWANLQSKCVWYPKNEKISQQSCERTANITVNLEVEIKLVRVKKERKSGFSLFTTTVRPYGNPMPPSELQHQHCPKHMGWGHETSDSKRFWFFWAQMHGLMDGQADGQKKGLGDSGPKVPL